MRLFGQAFTRRQFIKRLGLLGLQLSGLSMLAPYPLSTNARRLREALYYRRLADSRVKCELCFKGCTIAEGERGFCRARQNKKGSLYSLVYEKPVAVHIDPIEKAPLYHMLPGSDTLCLGTASCNFRCQFCINWEISQKSSDEIEAYPTSSAEVVQMALDHDIKTICFTYNEPTQLYEYMYDTVKLAKKSGLRTTFHTNGAMNANPLKALLQYMDAVAIDLKAFTHDFYQRIASAELTPVLNSLSVIKEEGVWMEVINLVIPTLNDDLEKIEEMCIYIREELGTETPVHFSRFFPAYNLTRLPPTPLKLLEEAYKIARNVGLDYVYIDNVPGHEYSNTFCPECGEMLIQRRRVGIAKNNIEEGRCKFCGHEIPGIWSFKEAGKIA